MRHPDLRLYSLAAALILKKVVVRILTNTPGKIRPRSSFAKSLGRIIFCLYAFQLNPSSSSQVGSDCSTWTIDLLYARA
jgi:hypothetical protein